MIAEHEPTWGTVLASYPAVRKLERMAREAGERDPDTYKRWYGEIKPMLTDAIRNTSCPEYNVAYEHLLRLYDNG